MADRCARLFWRWRRVPYGVPLSAHAAHVHGLAAGRPLPVTDIIAQTPAIPENCQWGLFLRNHDELTLEMVSDEERDTCTSPIATSAHARQRRHPPPARAAHGQQPAPHRTAEQAAVFSFRERRFCITATKLAWATTSTWAIETACGRPCSGTPTEMPAFHAPPRPSSINPVIMDPGLRLRTVNVEAQDSDPSSLLVGCAT